MPFKFSIDSGVLSTAWGIALIYAAVSFLWIYFSDSLLLQFGMQPHTLTQVQTWKGSAFVLVTALLLFYLLHQAIGSVRRGEALFRKVVETLPLGIWVLDATGNSVRQNEAAQHMLQKFGQEDLSALQGRYCSNGVPDAQGWSMQRDLQHTQIRQGECVEITGVDGTEYTILYTSLHFTSETAKSPMTLVMFQDISESRRTSAQLEYQSYHDALTGLPNRVLLDDRIQQAIVHAQRAQFHVVVFLLDIDRFKIINESLGHKQGDSVLVEVAARLRNCVRPGDTLSRLGGDEFAIVMTSVQQIADARLMAQKIIHAFEPAIALDSREIRITASLGASVYPRDGYSGGDLLRHADAAMYLAKGQGGNTFQFCSAELDNRAHKALDIEADLRQALEIGGFVLHYQPKVSIASGAVNGCEALIRWEHPHKGLIPPGDFIPLAEETGLIISMGDWVLREACRQFRSWQERGVPPLRIAVNISARQFAQRDFVKNILHILDEYAMDPHWLELELTESMVMEDPDKVAQTLAELKEIGLDLSLDDFGTGYSSLNYLRRFPIDWLKIDRSFITDVATDPTAASVVNSVVGIAHSLGIQAVAEGVETRAQYAFLAMCQCDSIQGYLASKPLPADELERLLLSKTDLIPVS